MSYGEESRDRGDGVVNGREVNAGRGGYSLENEHFMFDLDEMPMLLNEANTEHENQQNFNIRERDGFSFGRTLTEFDRLEEGGDTVNDSRMTNNQHGSFLPGNLSTTHVQETEDIDPVEVRLLAALQQEMSPSTGTVSLAQPFPTIPMMNAPTNPGEQKRVRLSNAKGNFLPSSMASVSRSLEYRNMFPAQDVANLRDHHWRILKYIISPKKLGLDSKDVETSSKDNKPSSAALDEMIEHLSGNTKLICLRFRETQKRTWRKGQQKCRAIARANKISNTPNPRVAQLGNFTAEHSSMQDRPNYRIGPVQPTLYENLGHHQAIRSGPRDPFPQTGYRTTNMQHRPFHPSARPSTYIPLRGIDEQRIMPTVARPQNRFPEAINYGNTGGPRLDRFSMASRPSFNLPDPRLLPRVVLPLSEEEKAHIRRWMVRRD